MCERCEETIFNTDGTRKALVPEVGTPVGFVASAHKELVRLETMGLFQRGELGLQIIHTSLDTVAKYDLTKAERDAVNLLLDGVKKARNIP